MREYMAQGAQLGWLIDPETRSIEIYRPNGEVERRTGIDQLEGEGPVAGGGRRSRGRWREKVPWPASFLIWFLFGTHLRISSA